MTARSESDNFFLNNPVFLKYKSRFSFPSFRKTTYLKSLFINERIAETPFALRALCPLPAGSRVLDLGCMESLLPLYLATAGFRVTGFDYRHYPYAHPNLTFVQGDITKLPFEAKSFDAVTCVSTIEHIGIGFYNDPRNGRQPDTAAMAEVKRVLADGGLLVLTVPFGKPATTSQQRIYDQAGVERLISGFKPLTRKYYVNRTWADRRNNGWVESDLATASAVDCSTRVDCVCCLTLTV